MNSNFKNTDLYTKEQRVKQIADLTVGALKRLHPADRGSTGLSGEVGLDNAGEPRVYVHPLESRGGRL